MVELNFGTVFLASHVLKLPKLAQTDTLPGTPFKNYDAEVIETMHRAYSASFMRFGHRGKISTLFGLAWRT